MKFVGNTNRLKEAYICPFKNIWKIMKRKIYTHLSAFSHVLQYSKWNREPAWLLPVSCWSLTDTLYKQRFA